MVNFSDQVVNNFRSSVTATYELDEEVVNSLCNFVRKAIEEVGLPAKSGRVRRTTTTRRKKSGYNIFVKEMMTDDENIKQLNHRAKMAAIGALWKALDEAGKAKYNDRAKEAAEADADTSKEAEEEAAE